MLQGVLARGTARSIAGLASSVAGKTGTSDQENDAWFVGFSNDVTVAVWVGYDNATGKRRTLGGGATGGAVAVPIFQQVMQAAWTNVAPRAALAPPSPEARRQLSCRSVELDTGELPQQAGGGRAITECFRIDRYGRVLDTQYKLVSREDAYVSRGYYSVAPSPNPFFGWPGGYEQRPGQYYQDNSGRQVVPRDPRAPQQQYGQPPPVQQYGQPPVQQYGQPWYYQRDPRAQDPRVQAPPRRDPFGREYQAPQRSDPGYMWGGRRYY
jgi:membrane peptidoglycan carboxypeptidase